MVMAVLWPSMVTLPWPEIPLPAEELIVKVPPVMSMAPEAWMAWSVEFIVNVPPVMLMLPAHFIAFMLAESSVSSELSSNPFMPLGGVGMADASCVVPAWVWV